jgi:glycosyltransferase involved in cell wall biosynthesis
VGRLVEKKGCEYLIRAMQMVQRDDPAVRLVVIGDGPLRDSLESLANSLLVRAEFIGIQVADSVSRWMNKARVLCVPTVRAANGDMDGCCMVFLEAHAMGLPVVAFNTGGTPEAVLHGQTGLLVTERDCDALADAIHQVVNDRLMWEQFSQAARLRVEHRFNLSTQNKRLEEIYNQLQAETYVSR